MTTIAYRDGVLAGDTRAFAGTPRPIGLKQKIFSIRGGSAFGIATPNPGLDEELKIWIQELRNFDHWPDLSNREFEMLEITADGQVFYYKNSHIPAGPLTADYFAIGTGAEYALGAMAHGADAVQAVVAASHHDVWTNEFVQQIVMNLPKDTENDEGEGEDEAA